MLEETVAALKEFIQEKTDLPINDQRVVFNGTVLEDDEATIASYGIQEEGTLNLAMRPGSEIDSEIAELRAARKAAAEGGGEAPGSRPGRSPLLSSRRSL